MKRIAIGAFTLLALLVTVGLLRGPQPARAQDAAAKATIEGRMHFANGKPVYTSQQDPCPLKLYLNGKIAESGGPENNMGGLYIVRPLEPGIYEVRVHAIHGHRPLRMMGVMIKPGTNILNINLSQGTELEERGKPVVARQPAIVIAEELERLQRQIDELKKK
jgi:hypothetical protein